VTHRKSLAALALLGPVIALAPARAAEPNLRVLRIASKVLGEERVVRVVLPPGYAERSEHYPVLYLTDAEDQLVHTAATADFLARHGRIPRLIVVGIDNVDRVRDFTPTPGPPRPGETVEHPGSGGADRFLEFIRAELIPAVDATFPTEHFRIFAGHSLGGLFALHVLETRPDTFSAYIAASPTIPWDDGYVLKRMRALLEVHREPKTRLYFTTASEPTRPGYEALKALLDDARALAWEARAFDDEDHGSVVLPSHYYGLRWIFADWPLPLADGKFRGTLADLEAHYRKLSARYGYAVLPPENVVNAYGYQLLAEKRIEEAIAALQLNVRNHGESANVHDSLGEALEAAGRLDEARMEYRTAVNRGEVAKDPATLRIFRLHLAAVEKRLAASPVR